MKNALFLALTGLSLVACGGGMDDRGPVDENVGESENQMSLPPGIAQIPTSYLINFDKDTSGTSLADGTIIDSTYTSLGVTFSGISCVPGSGCTTGHAFARAAVSPESAPNVVSQNTNTLPFFDARFGAVRADFATGRNWVSIDVMPVLTAADWITPPTSQPWFEAYDANNNLVGQVYYPIAFGATNWGSYQTLRIDAGSARIKWVRFSAQPPGSNTAEVFAQFDNLRFSTNIVRPCVIGLGC
jgi:hypothetical protein